MAKTIITQSDICPTLKIETTQSIGCSNEVKILGILGQTIATVKYVASKLPSCGSNVHIETDYPVDFIDMIPEDYIFELKVNEADDIEERVNLIYPL